MFIIFFLRTLLEKYDIATKSTIIKITISTTQLIFSYKTTVGIKTLNFSLELFKKKWTFITLQVLYSLKNFKFSELLLYPWEFQLPMEILII